MLTIRDYKNWATAHQNASVALDRDNANALAVASTRIGVFARTFNTRGAQRVRAEVMKDFTRALSTRYGASIAQQAISMAGLTGKSELKGWLIEQVVGFAKGLRNTMRSPVGEAQNLRLGTADIARVQVAAYLDDKRNVVTKFLNQRAVAVQLLGEIPLSPEDYADFHARATSLVDRLRAIRDAAVPEGIPEEDFRSGVDSLINAIEDKDNRAGALVEGKPLSAANVGEYKNLWRDAAVNAMTDLYEDVTRKEDLPAMAVVERALHLLKTDQATRANFNDRLVLSKDVEKQCIKPFIVGLLDAAKRQLAQENGGVDARRARIATDGIVKKIKAGFRKALNERAWPVVDKSLSVSVGNRPVAIRSRIAPAGQLGHSEQAPRGPIAGNYPENVNGYMCHSAETDHAVNLAVSNLTVGEPGGEQKTAFTGVRHGVHCAWEIRGDNARAEANANRAKEAVIAAFLAKYDNPGANPPQLPGPDENGTITVDLPMTSVSLLTPDPVRHKFQKNSAADERRMLREQSAAWDAVAQTGVEFEHRGRRIRIQPQILKFNFGVNEGAVNWPWPISNLTGGWRVSGPMNNAAFAVFEEQVQRFIDNHPADKANEANAAQTLLTQCRRILHAKGERADNHDAYKLAARIAVLSHLIGNVPCWNCKSGKDRTGEMDVECKFLSALIARGEQIPAPGARLTKEQKELFRSIALEGGNFELQKMNTGLAGFKTDGVDSIPERLGGQEYRDLHRGGSKYVNV